MAVFRSDLAAVNRAAMSPNVSPFASSAVALYRTSVRTTEPTTLNGGIALSSEMATERFSEKAPSLPCDFSEVLEWQDHERRATAYHEAAHAVIQTLFGFPVKFIKTFSEFDDYRNDRGFVRADRRYTSFLNHRNWGLRARERAGHWAISTLAGIQGEAKALGISWRRLRKSSGSGDYETAKKIAFRRALCDAFPLSDETLNAYLRLWEASAHSFVQMFWKNIDALARELAPREYVEGDELRKLMERIMKVSSSVALPLPSGACEFDGPVDASRTVLPFVSFDDVTPELLRQSDAG